MVRCVDNVVDVFIDLKLLEAAKLYVTVAFTDSDVRLPSAWQQAFGKASTQHLPRSSSSLQLILLPDCSHHASAERTPLLGCMIGAHGLISSLRTVRFL